VTGALTLDEFGNQLIVSAHTDASGQARGSIVLESGISGVNGQSHRRIFIDVTCLEVSGNTAFVGGTTIRSTPGLGTVHPQYGFVLEDGGLNGTDRSTIFALFATNPANPCADLFGPAVATSIRGNIRISDGTV
jgi:hypothetical protein